MGCHSYVDIVNIKPYNYKPKDYITKELTLYEPEESLYPILDSIIKKVEVCPEYQNRMEKVFFFFNISNGNTSGPKDEWDNPLVGISVNYYLFRLSDFRSTQGVFYYKGYDFFVDDMFVEILLRKMDKTVSITCVAPEKYKFDILYRGDTDMYWIYRYQHGTLVNVQHGYCPEP